MAFVSECLQSMIVGLGNDASALVIDAYSFKTELARLVASRAELEQERAIDQRQYLHSIVAAIDGFGIDHDPPQP